MVAPTPPAASTFQLPDLFAHCQNIPLTYHKNGDAIAASSDKWFENGCRAFTEEQRRQLYGLKGGQLAAYVYHDCDDGHLRVVCDFLNFLFHLDDISDGMMTNQTEILAAIVMNALSFPHSYNPIDAKGNDQPEEESDVWKLARDFWTRCIQDAGPEVQVRFCEHLKLFFEAVSTQAKARENGIIPDLNFYIDVRRNNSGDKPLFDLLEYSLRIILPSFVVDDPIIEALKESANDFIAWSNDIFSYNAEQARGDTFNMVNVLMEHHGMDLQSAVDCIGEMCRGCVDNFCENRKKVPSWSPEIDRDVSRYVHGLESWISGVLHWSFISERYFGGKGIVLKKNLLVELAPRRVQAKGT